LDVSFQPDSDYIVAFGILSWCSLVGECHSFRGTYFLPWSFLIGYVTLEDEATIWSQNIRHHAPNDSKISQRNGDLNSSSGTQEILRFLWKPKICHRVIIIAQLPLSSCATLIHFTIIPPSTPGSFRWLHIFRSSDGNPVCISLLPHTCSMPCPILLDFIPMVTG
jgi:hypothetical protein